MASSTPVTVTVWGRFQFWVVKVSGPETVATVSSWLMGVTVTSPVGWVFSTTV